MTTMPTGQPVTRLHRSRVADQIVDDLLGQIMSGALENGSRLPSEHELASHYEVSGPTIREALRVLTAIGMLSTKNGSRTTVTTGSDTLLVMSIASVVQFAKMSAGDVLGLLGTLNAYAAELAVARASDDEIARLREMARRTADVTDVEAGAEALKQFFVTLSEISHNPLLAALCRTITAIQIGLAVALSGGDPGDWGQIAGAPSLHTARMEIVEAIARRDDDRARTLVNAYHEKVIKRVRGLPRTRELREQDPGLSLFLASWLRANVKLGSRE